MRWAWVNQHSMHLHIVTLSKMLRLGPAFSPLSRETRRIQSRIEFIYLFIYLFIYMHQPRSSCAALKNFSLVNSLQQKLIG